MHTKLFTDKVYKALFSHREQRVFHARNKIKFCVLNYLFPIQEVIFFNTNITRLNFKIKAGNSKSFYKK